MYLVSISISACNFEYFCICDHVWYVKKKDRKKTYSLMYDMLKLLTVCQSYMLLNYD